MIQAGSSSHRALRHGPTTISIHRFQQHVNGPAPGKQRSRTVEIRRGSRAGQIDVNRTNQDLFTLPEGLDIGTR
jgi:hypothetical protein